MSELANLCDPAPPRRAPRFLDARAFGFDCDGTLIHETANILPGVRIGNHCRIDAFVTITRGSLGSWVHIGTGCGLFGAIEMQDFSALSPGVMVFAATENNARGLTNPTIPPAHRFPLEAPVTVERHAVIGSNAVVLPGAHLGAGCIVGALSLVKGSLPAWTICGGVPARALKPRQTDALAHEALLLRGGTA